MAAALHAVCEYEKVNNRCRLEKRRRIGAVVRVTAAFVILCQPVSLAKSGLSCYHGNDRRGGMEDRYTVHQASEMTGTKSYVLRYWEEELELNIHRNELGHRYYTGYDIQLFLNIKELKNRGLQLRAIKELIPKLAKTPPGFTKSKTKLLEGETVGDDPGTLEMEKTKKEPEKVREAAEKTVSFPGCEKQDTKILEFQQILERLIDQEMHLKKDGESRCRSLDEAIRRQQLARKEAAVSAEKKGKKRQKIHNPR